MGNPSGTSPAISFEQFCDRVTAASGGRLTLEPYFAGAIVPALEGFYGVNDGVLDFCPDPTSFLVGQYPAAGLFTYMISGLSPTEQLHWYIVGGGKELAQEYFEAGTDVKILGVPSQIRPAETFLWSNKPINTVDDIKGLKFRTGGDDGKIFTKLGASVMMVAPGEIYESMQRGILDAFQLSSPSTDKSFAAHEVADYAYLSPVRQPGELAIMQMNKARWAELPDDLKLIFEGESLAASIWHYTRTLKEDIEVLDFYENYGTIVEPASPAVVDAIAKEAVILYDEMSAGDPFYARVVESMREFQQVYRDTFPRL